MDDIDLTHFEDDGSFVVKLVGPSGIRAETLAEIIGGIAQSLHAVGEAVDPVHTLDVIVSRLEPGSVNIVVRVKQHLKRNAGTYVAAAVTADIIVGLFTNYLYDLIRPAEVCEVSVDADKITVQGSNCRVTIRREVYDLRNRIDGNPRVAEGAKRALEAAKKDRAVRSLGVGTKLNARPVVTVGRADFDVGLLRASPMTSGYTLKLDAREALTERDAPTFRTRELDVSADLTIVKAVLLRGKRKWQFNWQGIKISAPIADPDFFDQLESRAIALRQGDALEATLRIQQRFLPEARVWENTAYTVMKVLRVRLGETQTTMDLSVPHSRGSPS